MGITINTNVQSLNAQRVLGGNVKSLGKSLEKLSSGYRINRASDDAAGLQISEGLRSQIRGSDQANSNVQDGINLLNTTDGSLETITNNLQRIRELAVQGGNDTLATDQRSAIDKEIQQLAKDVSRIANASQFNKRNLLDGTSTSLKIQVGANVTSATNTIDLATAGTNPFGDSRATALNLLGAADAVTLSVKSNGSALKTLSIVDAALQNVQNRRAAIGALTNRLEGASTNLQISSENFSASESRIRNADIAKESAALTRNQVLQQASAQILGQANQTSQLALSLLRG
ncbi:MAG: flagellin FliC [Vampirovibrio sp.]|nr:flagellin FliC [Vampirovibrio sp.]